MESLTKMKKIKTANQNPADFKELTFTFMHLSDAFIQSDLL